MSVDSFLTQLCDNLFTLEVDDDDAARRHVVRRRNCDDGEHKCPACPWKKAAKYAHGDACPECRQPLFYDPGHDATHMEPGVDPCIYCTDCGLTFAVDWVRQAAVE